MEYPIDDRHLYFGFGGSPGSGWAIIRVAFGSTSAFGSEADLAGLPPQGSLRWQSSAADEF